MTNTKNAPEHAQERRKAQVYTISEIDALNAVEALEASRRALDTYTETALRLILQYTEPGEFGADKGILLYNQGRQAIDLLREASFILRGLHSAARNAADACAKETDKSGQWQQVSTEETPSPCNEEQDNEQTEHEADSDTEALGATLEKRRRERGITYAELSRRTKINEDKIARFCKGTLKPSGDEFVRVCVELGLEVEDFFADSEPEKRGNACVSIG